MATSQYDEMYLRYKHLRPLVAAISGMASGNVAPVRDDSGEYSNLGLHFDSGRDGLVYTVRIPKYAATSSTECTKLGANAGRVCEPSTNAVAGRDDYAGKGPFRILTVNAFVDDDGLPHTTHVEGYGDGFSRTGESGDVWVAVPVLWWKWDDTGEYTDLSVTDTPRVGFEPQPGAKLPDGTLRPYMLYSAYMGGMYGGKLASVSGVAPLVRTVSHNSLYTLTRAKGAGYSGGSYADHWYVHAMFLLKYAQKSSQKVYGGCTNYSQQYTAAVSESGVSRVILPASQAAQLLVGSSLDVGSMDGDATKSKDRGSAWVHDLADSARITRVEAYDGSNSAVYLDCAPIDAVAGVTLVSTMPWRCGCCDNVQGADGSPSSALSTKEPFRLQGIELMVGCYDTLGDVRVQAREAADGTLVNDVLLCRDSARANDASAYESCGSLARSDGAAAWLYQQDLANAGGMLIGVGSGASSSTGTGDATYSVASTSSGTYEYLSLGSLHDGAHGGLACVGATYSLGSPTWYFGGRLSGVGRSAA